MNTGRMRWLLAGLLLLGMSGLGGVAAGQDDTEMGSRGDAETGPLATYSLTWWTADGGGASYGTTGSYTLGGTAGQPDAAVPRTGGVYTLRPGFWLPSCVAAAVRPAITRHGNTTVTLSWTHNTANQAYQVHRGTMPYFTPTDATRRTIVTAAPWSYTDPDVVIGDPDTNYYYVLRATCGAAYSDPGRVGEFDFRLVPGN